MFLVKFSTFIAIGDDLSHSQLKVIITVITQGFFFHLL